jgi:hypothetical protein
MDPGYVRVISKIKQKNDQEFPLIDVKDLDPTSGGVEDGQFLARVGTKVIGSDLLNWEKVRVVAKTGGQYDTITKAITAANDWDTILICPGEYEEVLDTGSKILGFIGLGTPDNIIIGPLHGQFCSDADEQRIFTLQNLTIKNSDPLHASSLLNCYVYGYNKNPSNLVLRNLILDFASSDAVDGLINVVQKDQGSIISPLISFEANVYIENVRCKWASDTSMSLVRFSNLVDEAKQGGALNARIENLLINQYLSSENHGILLATNLLGSATVNVWLNDAQMDTLGAAVIGDGIKTSQTLYLGTHSFAVAVDQTYLTVVDLVGISEEDATALAVAL